MWATGSSRPGPEPPGPRTATTRPRPWKGPASSTRPASSRATPGPATRSLPDGGVLPMSTADQAVMVSEGLASAPAAAVLALAERAARADGVAPLSEQGLLHVRYGGAPAVRDLVASSDGRIAGYARLDPPAGGEPASGELVIDPEFRRRGLGRALAEAMAGLAGETGLQVWAHGDQPAASALAAAAGFE